MSNSFANINRNQRYDGGHGHGSTANEWEVENRDEYQMQNDTELAELGFEIPEYMFGKGGRQLETNCIWPTNASRMPPTIDKVDLSGEDPPDEVIIQNAIDKSPLRSDWSNRRENLRDWQLDLYRKVCDELYLYLKSTIYEDSEEFTEEMVKELVKPVPALGTKLDFKNNVDCLFVFHELYAYLGNTEGENHKSPSQKEAYESTYWDPQFDTVVTIDCTVSLDHKNANRNKADIISSKTASISNPYLKRRGEEPITEIRGGFSYEDRMQALAERIVDAYQKKSGLNGNFKLPHVYNPEVESASRIQEDRKRTNAEIQEAASARKAREQRKKEKRKKQSEDAKAKKKARKQAA